MSDTFDHACEAFESLWHDDEYDGHDDEYEFYNYCNSSDHDELYYHHELHHYHRVTLTIESRTEKAYLCKDAKGTFWCPKKLLVFDGISTYLWDGFKKKYLETTIEAVKEYEDFDI